jgi:hypothetical protein
MNPCPAIPAVPRTADAPLPDLHDLRGAIWSDCASPIYEAARSARHQEFRQFMGRKTRRETDSEVERIYMRMFRQARRSLVRLSSAGPREAPRRRSAAMTIARWNIELLLDEFPRRMLRAACQRPVPYHSAGGGAISINSSMASLSRFLFSGLGTMRSKPAALAAAMSSAGKPLHRAMPFKPY